MIRVLLGVTLIAGGAGLLALDPAQPQQPTLVLPVELGAEARALQPTHAHTDRWLDRAEPKGSSRPFGKWSIGQWI